MNKQLPNRPDLEHLKNQAKALLNSANAGEQDALSRIQTYGFSAPLRLAQAQSVLAKEYGFPNWAKLKREVETQVSRHEAFFQAVRAGDHSLVSRLLDEEAELSRATSQREFGAPALNLAANRNDLKMIDLLLDRGADVNARSSWWAGGFGALDFANEEVSAHLIRRGANLTAHAAARLGLADALREILYTNPNSVRERGGDGQFPLHFAKTAEVVDLLVDAGADLDARDLDHCATAIQWRVLDSEPRDQLLERGATPDVFTAVLRDDPDLLSRLLMENPGDADRKTTEEGNPLIPKAPGAPIYLYLLDALQPYQVAWRFGKRAAFEALFSIAPPAKRVAMACWSGDSAQARRLAAQHPDWAASLSKADSQGLPDAAWNRKLAEVKLMLDLGWDVDAVGSEQSTAIDRAAFHGFDDVIEALLAHRPNLMRENAYGGRPLECCLYGSMHGWRKDGDYVRSVELLVRAGAPKPRWKKGSPEVIAKLAELRII